MQLMDSKSVKRLIVVDANDKMVGIITEKDILSRIVKHPNMIQILLTKIIRKGVKFTQDLLNVCYACFQKCNH
jgi:CBS domain-containing protein